MAYRIQKDKCIGCELCMNECNFAAITKDGEKCKINPEICVECGACSMVCPVQAPELD